MNCLDLQRVKARPRDDVLPHALDQLPLVNDRAPGGIDKEGGRLHESYLPRPDRVAGLIVQGAVDAHEVGRR